MAGFHLPGDPYFHAMGNNGWIDPEEEPEEDPEEDPEEEQEPMDDEEPVEDPESDSDDDEHILESDEDLDDDDGDEDLGSGEVINPVRAIEMSMHDPRPPPSHTLYRHPGGALWKHTPRKSTFPVPRSTYEVGQSSQAAPSTARQPSAEEEIARMAAHIQTLEETMQTRRVEASDRSFVYTHRIQTLAGHLEQARLAAEQAEQRAAELQRQLDEWMRQHGPGSGSQ